MSVLKVRLSCRRGSSHPLLSWLHTLVGCRPGAILRSQLISAVCGARQARARAGPPPTGSHPVREKTTTLPPGPTARRQAWAVRAFTASPLPCASQRRRSPAVLGPACVATFSALPRSLCRIAGLCSAPCILFPGPRASRRQWQVPGGSDPAEMSLFSGMCVWAVHSSRGFSPGAESIQGQGTVLGRALCPATGGAWLSLVGGCSGIFGFFWWTWVQGNFESSALGSKQVAAFSASSIPYSLPAEPASHLGPKADRAVASWLCPSLGDDCAGIC